MIVDTTTINFFQIPSYIFFAGIGFVISICVFILSLLSKRVQIEKYVVRSLISLIFLLIGAKLFGIILNIITALYTDQPITKELVLNAGIVYYGGLIGLLSSFLIICKLKDKRLNGKAIDSLTISIPIFHAFGRIGCFFAGCCYGIPCENKISVLYTNVVDGSLVTISRLPIQLIEATENIVLFIALCIIDRVITKKGLLLPIYLGIYSILRFINETLRDDWERLMFGGISMSQFISVFLLIASVIILIYNSKTKEHFKDG